MDQKVKFLHDLLHRTPYSEIKFTLDENSLCLRSGNNQADIIPIDNDDSGWWLAERLLHTMYNSRCSNYKVVDVYKVKRSYVNGGKPLPESDAFINIRPTSSPVDRRILMHGSENHRLASILTKGLQPGQKIRSHVYFGPGIFFADSLDTAMNFTSQDCAFQIVLICEVDLGKK